MKLMTKELEAKFPRLYANENKKPEEVKIVAKFFFPGGPATWYATEYDPETRNFFGFADLGDPDCAELGYFSLDELESFRSKQFRIGIERDRYFGEEHTLKEILDGARP